MSELVTVKLGGYADLIKWAKENQMPRDELDKRSVVICLGCEDWERCGNLRMKDWCYMASTPAILSWAEEVKKVELTNI